MNKIITFETLSNFCYTNINVVKKPIKGIVLEFFGLGSCRMIDNDEMEPATEYGGKGLLWVVPYNNPWNWMNPQAIAYTDELLDVVRAAYGTDLPLAVNGLSMGGLDALTYCCYTKHPFEVCGTNCAVCDLVYHYGERKDLPRTLYSAFWHEEGNLLEVLSHYSPYHIADKLPRIPYMMVHSLNDDCVNIEKHPRPFVEKMKRLGYDVTYIEDDSVGHCTMTKPTLRKYYDFLEEKLLNRE